MALKQLLTQKQTQKLSPLQMQVIKLIELNTVELEDRIRQEVEDNPAIEVSDDIKDTEISEGLEVDNIDSNTVAQDDLFSDDYYSDDENPNYNASNFSNDIVQREFNYSSERSLIESLKEQLSLINLDDRKRTIAEYIIGNIDENGYLQRDLNAITNDLLFQENLDVSTLEIEDVLYEIQDLDPSGVGARNLRECLLIQLQRKEHTPQTETAVRIITDCFEEFSRKHYDKIIKTLEITEDELRDAIEEIVSLNPKPGNEWSDSLEMAMSNITPDFIVESENGEVVMYLNDQNVPELKVNHDFAEMIKGYSQNKESMSNQDKQSMFFMKQKVDSAKWFIDSVKQRQKTLRRTMQAIIAIQYDFFLTEDETALKPMILKDISERTGLDISTISRVSNSKYVQTYSGVYPLKYFFSEAMQNDAGEDISSREIKFILKETIENENASKPLTDEQLTKLLNQKGYLIARRTVAKYREQLNIPVARLRKKI